MAKLKPTRKLRKERKKNGYNKNSVKRTKHWKPTRLFKNYDNDDDEDFDNDDDEDLENFYEKASKRRNIKHRKATKSFDHGSDFDVNNGEDESTRKFTKRRNVDDDDARETDDEQTYTAGRDYVDEDNLDKYGLLFW